MNHLTKYKSKVNSCWNSSTFCITSFVSPPLGSQYSLLWSIETETSNYAWSSNLAATPLRHATVSKQDRQCTDNTLITCNTALLPFPWQQWLCKQTSNVMSVCLYSWLSHPACKSHLFCSLLYCHLWLVRLYHIVSHYLVSAQFLAKVYWT